MNERGGGRGEDDAPRFAGLALLLHGYFHEDFRAEHGTHEAAARAFARDASEEELAEARMSLSEFLEWAGAESTGTWQAGLRRAGGSWRPRSLEPLREVLEILRG